MTLIEKRITELISQLEREANYFESEINRRIIGRKQRDEVIAQLEVRILDRKNIIKQLKDILGNNE